MAPPNRALVLHEKKEVDSISNNVAEVQYNAPPSLPEVNNLNKQFKMWTLVYERVCLSPYSVVCKRVEFPVK
jgi:hypothetical protein